MTMLDDFARKMSCRKKYTQTAWIFLVIGFLSGCREEGTILVRVKNSTILEGSSSKFLRQWKY